MLPVLERDADSIPRCHHRAATSGSFLRACVLLLLHERPSHGYDLLDRLERFGFDAGDSGWLYRTLRSLEHDGQCASAWESSPAGPRRRIYHLTPHGEEALASSVDALHASVRAMETYLDRYVVARSEALSTTQVVGPRPSQRRDP